MGQPALLLAAFLVYNGFWGNPPVSPAAVGSFLVFAVNVVFLLIATLGEEIGWRGAALPRLQARFTPLVSSLILGLLWETWHIPFWLLMDTFDQYGFEYLVLNFLLFPLTLYITWIFNHTRASLLLPVVLHLAFNIVNTALLPVTLNIGAFRIFLLFEWVIALVIFRHLDPSGGRKEP